MDRSVRLLTLGVAVRVLGSALYSPFLALFLYNELGLGYLQITLIIVALGVVQIPFGILGGLGSDRIGHRRMILIGLSAEAIATFGLGYAFSIHSLLDAIAAGLAGGTVAAAAGPAFSAYIADRTTGSDRTRGFTWYRIGFNAGFSAGVAIGGLLVGTLGYSGAVYVAAGVIGAATLALAIFLPPSEADRPRDLGSIGTQKEVGTIVPPRKSMGQSMRELVHDRVALELALAIALVTMVAAQWSVTFPLYVHNVLGITYTFLGFGLAMNGLLVVLAQNWTTRSVLGRRHTTIGIVGTSFYAIAFLGLGAAGLWGIVPLAIFFVAVVVLTEGENLISIPGATLPSNISPVGETGAYNGVFQAVGNGAGLIAILLGGVVLTYISNSLLIWAILTAPAVPAILLLRHAARTIPRSANTA